MNENQGVKHDQGKLRLDLLPFDAINEVAAVLTFGAKKYGDRNWEKGISYSRCFGAALRHLFAWFRGEDRDPESGLSHLAHAACNTLMILAFVLRGTSNALDDMPNRPNQPKPLQGEEQAHEELAIDPLGVEVYETLDAVWVPETKGPHAAKAEVAAPLTKPQATQIECDIANGVCTCVA